MASIPPPSIPPRPASESLDRETPPRRVDWFLLRVVGYAVALLTCRAVDYGLALSLIGNGDSLAPWYTGAALLVFPVVLGTLVHAVERRRGDPRPARRRRTVVAVTVLALPVPYELLLYAVVGPDGPIIHID